MRINKITKIIFTFIFLYLNLNKLNAQIDSAAVAVLDKMSNGIGNLHSCSLTLVSEYDISDPRLGLVTHSEESDIFLKAPNKLLVNKKGDKGKKDFFYDGKSFTYFSVDNNQYSTAQAPPTIVETIDSIHNTYGIDFPAADIFYPTFVDDILAIANNLSDLGLTTVDNKECYHIAGTTKEFTFQIWVSKDESYLPLKMAMVYTDKPGNPHYEAFFENWNLNPSLEDSMFNFTVPPQAKKVKFVSKN